MVWYDMVEREILYNFTMYLLLTEYILKETTQYGFTQYSVIYHINLHSMQARMHRIFYLKKNQHNYALKLEHDYNFYKKKKRLNSVTFQSFDLVHY